MNRWQNFILLLLGVSLTWMPASSFAEDCQGNKEAIGTVVGALLGGLLGSQVG